MSALSPRPAAGAPTTAAPPPRDHGWHHFLRTVLARAYPRVVGQQREKAWIFFETFLPFVATAGYVLVYRAMRAPDDYVGFVVVGGAMIAFWMNIMWSMSAQLYWEKENGNLPLYIMAPNSMMAIMLGMALGGLLATSVRATVVLLLGSWVFHVHYAVASLPQLLLVFALTMVALYGLGMLFASLFLLMGRDAWQVVNLLQEPVYFVAGFYFPVRSFGFAIALAASIVPLTLGLDAMRQLVFASGPTLGFLSVPIEAGGLAVLSAIFLVAAKYWLGRMEHLAVIEGTLGDRRR